MNRKPFVWKKIEEKEEYKLQDFEMKKRPSLADQLVTINILFDAFTKNLRNEFYSKFTKFKKTRGFSTQTEKLLKCIRAEKSQVLQR